MSKSQDVFKSSTLSLVQQEEPIRLAPYAQFLVDSLAELTIDMVLSQPLDAKFKKYESKHLEPGDVFWLRISIQNTLPIKKDFVLEIPFCNLDRVDLYEVASDNSIILKQAGYLISIENRDLINRYPAFRISFNPEEEKVLYLNLKKTISDTPLWISSSAAFHKRSSNDHLSVGIFIGIISALLFYNLLIWFKTRIKHYSYYILFQCSVLLHTIFYDGLLYTFPFTYDRFQINVILQVLSCTAMISFILFAQGVLKLKQLAPSINAVLNLGKWVFFLYCILNFYSNYLITFVTDVSILIAVLIITGTSVYLSFKKYKPAYYFSTFFLVTTSCLIIENFMYYSGSYPNIHFDKIFYIGMGSTFILFSLLLADFIKDLERKTIKSQAEALNHLRSVGELRNKYTVNLEHQVRKRTAEVDKKNQILESQSIKLKELDKAKSRFFANISHELRTPLTLISGHLKASIQKKYGELTTKLSSNLEVSYRNSRLLEKFIENILDLSKMEARQLELYKRPTNIQNLINKISDSFDSFLHGNGVVFQSSCNIPLGTIAQIDDKKTEQILMNMLSNAAKFTMSGGAINLQVEVVSNKERECLLFKVMDTGKGIHEKDLPHIFDRFYQSQQTKSPIEGGTGIGLALAKELAGLMNGYLEVESELEKGSTFTLTIPVHLEKEPITSKSRLKNPSITIESIESNSDQYSKMREYSILIVEDHDDMREYIRQQIPNEYEVLEAGSGLEALQLLKKHSIDLIISDIMMPHMDGFQLLETLRSKQATKDISVIMITARAAQEDRLRALTIGVEDYLIKPFDEQELVARIRHIVKNRKSQKKWLATLPESETSNHSADQLFLTNVEEVVFRAIPDSNYGVFQMAVELKVSQRHLYRKIKSVTGLSPLQFIREIRLQKARLLLENHEKETIAEVMYAVGFQQSNHFAKIYKKRFGRLPSEHFKLVRQKS